MFENTWNQTKTQNLHAILSREREPAEDPVWAVALAEKFCVIFTVICEAGISNPIFTDDEIALQQSAPNLTVGSTAEQGANLNCLIPEASSVS